MAGLVQMAAQLSPGVQRAMFEGLQGLAPRAIQEGGSGLSSLAVSAVQKSLPGTWTYVAAGIAVGGVYFFQGSLNQWLSPILENTNRLREESKGISQSLNRLEEKRAEEIQRLNATVEILVLEREGLRKVLKDQSTANETLERIATELKEHASRYADKMDGLVSLTVQQGLLAEKFAELLKLQDEEGAKMNAQTLERLRTVNEIYRQLNRMFPS